jgi:hypothetical protein
MGFRTGTRIPDPLFPHLAPPAIMVWIFVWKYIFEPFIHILQHFVLQLSLVLLTFVSRSSCRITYNEGPNEEKGGSGIRVPVIKYMHRNSRQIPIDGYK